MRPRFIVILVAAAVVAALFAIARWPVAWSDALYARRILGFEVVGAPARIATLIEPLLFLAVAVGLWLLRPWARGVTMAYLAYVIVAFLFFGAGPTDGRRATAVMLWQVSVVPFATFCFMFLYNGARFFRARDHRATPPPIGSRGERASLR